MRPLVFLLFISLSAKAQWTIQTVNTSANLLCVDYYDASHVFIGRAGTTTLTSDGGLTWQHRNLVNPSNTPYSGSEVYDLNYFSPLNGVATGGLLLGNTMGVLNTSNAGVNWTMPYLNNGGNYPRLLNKFSFTSSTDGFGAGSNGYIIRTTNGGNNWGLLSSGITAEIYTVFFPSAAIGFAGYNGGILRTTNSGTTWINTPMSGTTIREIWFADNTTGYAAGTNGSAGVFLKTTDGGINWVSMPNPISGGVYELTGTGLDTIYLSTGNKLYYSTSGGAWWTYFPSTTGYTLNDIDFLNNSDSAYAVGNNGIALKTTNGGGTLLNPVSLCAAQTATTVCAGGTVSFYNYGNPAWSYQWQINNVTVSTAFNATLTFNTGGNHQVKLIAFDGVNYDTSLPINITVNTPPVVLPINPVIQQNPLCPGWVAIINVPNSQVGVSYQLMLNGITPVGGALSGSGGTRTFYTPPVSVTEMYSIRGTATNGCGPTVVFSPMLTVVVDLVNNALTVDALHDTICSGTADTVMLLNSVPGVSYVLRNTAGNVGPAQTGNGGTLYFPTGNLMSTTVFNVLGTNSTGCFAQMQMTQTVTVIMAQAIIGNTAANWNTFDTLHLINNSTATTFLWNFGPNAIPQVSSVAAPAVVYTASGMQQIILTATTSGCVSHDTLVFLASHLPPAGQGVLCSYKNHNFRFGNQGGIGYEILDYCTDLNGNTYATGYYDSAWSQTMHHLIVLKFDSVGNLVWMHKQNMANYNPNYYNNSFGTSIAVDSLGNFYVGGCFSAMTFQIDTLVFNTTNYLSRMRGFVVKFNAAGVAQWKIDSYSGGLSPVETGVSDISIRNNNDIYFSFIAHPSISYSLPGGTITNPGYLNIAHCSASGSPLGSVTASPLNNNPAPMLIYLDPSSGNFIQNRVAIVSPRLAIANDTLYVAGIISDPMVFGSHTVLMQGFTTGMVAKLNMNTQQWAGTFCTFHSSAGTNFFLGAFPVFTVDHIGQVYWSWKYYNQSFSQQLTVGSSSYSGLQKSFIAKYAPSGQPIWTRVSSSGFEVRALAAVTGGQVIGFSQTAATHYPGSNFTYMESSNNSLFGFPTQGGLDAFLFAYSSTGTLDWTRRIRSEGIENAHLMVPVNCEKVALIGQSNDTVVFHNDTIARGVNNLFVTKYAINGNCGIPVCVNPLWAAQPSTLSGVCAGTCVNLSVNASYGVLPYSYHWMPGNLSGSAPSVCPLVSTTYTCTITDAAGDTVTVTQLVNVSPAPPVGISGPTSVCINSGITLTASGANSYVWQPGNLSGSQITVSPVATTTYIVSGTNSAGCSANDTLTVNVYPTPVVSATADSIMVCLLSNTNLHASGASTYTWQPGNLSGSTVSVTVTGVTTYTVTGIAVCADTATITVYPIYLPSVSLDLSPVDTQCVSVNNVPLSGGTPPGGTYSGPGVNGMNFSPALTGPGYSTITYTYTDTTGCPASATASIWVDICTAAAAESEMFPMNVHPNPASQYIMLSCENCTGSYALTVLDIYGNLIENRIVPSAGNKIDVSRYASGIYYLKLVQGGKQWMQKLTVVK